MGLRARIFIGSILTAVMIIQYQNCAGVGGSGGDSAGAKGNGAAGTLDPNALVQFIQLCLQVADQVSFDPIGPEPGPVLYYSESYYNVIGHRVLKAAIAGGQLFVGNMKLGTTQNPDMDASISGSKYIVKLSNFQGENPFPNGAEYILEQATMGYIAYFNKNGFPSYEATVANDCKSAVGKIYSSGSKDPTADHVDINVALNGNMLSTFSKIFLNYTGGQFTEFDVRTGTYDVTTDSGNYIWEYTVPTWNFKYDIGQSYNAAGQCVNQTWTCISDSRGCPNPPTPPSCVPYTPYF